MNNRIKEVRKSQGLTLEKFGERVGLKKNSLSQIENGVNNPTEQLIKSICREFDVSEDWLRTGEGSMFVEKTKAQIAARIVGNAFKSDNEFMLNTFIALGQLSPEEWKVIESFVDKLKRDK